MSAATEPVCSACGRQLAAGAAFCRGCGARVAAPARPDPIAPQARPPRRRRRPWLLLACLAAALAGVATAILLVGGEDSSSGPGPTASSGAVERTVPTDPVSSATTETETETGTATSTLPASTASAAISAGRYVQAGSFRTVAGAEAEQSRLEAAGAEVSVESSDLAQDLYPGFQVLLAGPLADRSEERALLAVLRRSGVPSAFARGLEPALEVSGPDAVVGEWSGTLELSGASNPARDGPLPARWSAGGDGSLARLEFPGRNCTAELSLLAATDLTISFSQDRECVGGGNWVVRPEGGGLALTLLPPGTELIVTGRLSQD